MRAWEEHIRQAQLTPWREPDQRLRGSIDRALVSSRFAD
jgi:hypothetical protein